MNTNKENYIAPRVEIIILEVEQCIAVSFGNGASGDAAAPSIGKTSGSYWKSSSTFLNSDD